MGDLHSSFYRLGDDIHISVFTHWWLTPSLLAEQGFFIRSFWSLMTDSQSIKCVRMFTWSSSLLTDGLHPVHKLYEDVRMILIITNWWPTPSEQVAWGCSYNPYHYSWMNCSVSYLRMFTWSSSLMTYTQSIGCLRMVTCSSSLLPGSTFWQYTQLCDVTEEQRHVHSKKPIAIFHCTVQRTLDIFHWVCCPPSKIISR